MRTESMKANARIEPFKGSLREMIFDWIKANGDVITEDVLIAFSSLRYSTVTARVSELRKDGRLIQVGVRQTKYSGSDAAVLRAVETEVVSGVAA